MWAILRYQIALVEKSSLLCGFGRERELLPSEFPSGELTSSLSRNIIAASLALHPTARPNSRFLFLRFGGSYPIVGSSYSPFGG